MTTNALLGYDTIVDVVNQYSSMDGNAGYLEVVNTLARRTPLIKILPMVPSNQIMSEIGSRSSTLTTPGTRRFNEYVAPSTTHTTPFTEPICMIEDWSEVDAALCKIQNDPARWRADKDMMKVESFGQKADDMILYGNIGTDPGGLNGVMTRYNSLTRRPNGDTTWPYHVIDGGGTGSDLASVLVMQFGKDKVCGLYPKNMPAGLQITNEGEVTSESTTKRMRVLRTHFVWYLGLKVGDERCIQRYANIETTGTSNIFDEDKLIQAIDNLPDSGQDPSTTIFVPRAIMTALKIRAKDKNNVQYMPNEVWGARNILHFQGIPVMMDEMMDTTETAVA